MFEIIHFISRHGEAHYTVKTFYGSTKAAGTLIISDKQADRLDIFL